MKLPFHDCFGAELLAAGDLIGVIGVSFKRYPNVDRKPFVTIS